MPGVHVVGDSLTYNATRHFPTDWRLYAKAGRALYQSLTILERDVAPKRPQIVVLALGSNDVNDRRSVDEMTRNINAAVGKVPRALSFVITSVKVKGVNPIYGTHWKTYAAQWNELIEEGDIPVADWNSLAENNPQWFIADGLHMNNIGEKAYANHLKNRVKNVRASLGAE